jgi:hypothetical protein
MQPAGALQRSSYDFAPWHRSQLQLLKRLQHAEYDVSFPQIKQHCKTSILVSATCVAVLLYPACQACVLLELLH